MDHSTTKPNVSTIYTANVRTSIALILWCMAHGHGWRVCLTCRKIVSSPVAYQVDEEFHRYHDTERDHAWLN